MLADDAAIVFDDLAAGRQSFPHGPGGDFVVKRADGMFSYQLAVVVDDAAMGVTDVLRGSDLLDSTPRQLVLFEALGLTPPRYAHVPLLNGPDGRRLSKRHGDVSLAALRQAGASAERIVGYLAYWSGLLERPEPVRAEELIPGFRLSRVPDQPVTVSADMLRRLGAGKG
jgi:glutamyl-tRNA synthetase